MHEKIFSELVYWSRETQVMPTKKGPLHIYTVLWKTNKIFVKMWTFKCWIKVDADDSSADGVLVSGLSYAQYSVLRHWHRLLDVFLSKLTDGYISYRQAFFTKIPPVDLSLLLEEEDNFNTYILFSALNAFLE
jgi:hypothetical protein